MIKTTFTSILLFFLSLYVLSSPIIWATYFVYKDYIAKTYCVNKQDPICCGQCHVREVEDQAPKNESPKIEVRTPEISLFVSFTLKYSEVEEYSLTCFAPYLLGNTSIGFTNEIFQPPKLLS